MSRGLSKKLHYYLEGQGDLVGRLGFRVSGLGISGVIMWLIEVISILSKPP